MANERNHQGLMFTTHNAHNQRLPFPLRASRSVSLAASSLLPSLVVLLILPLLPHFPHCFPRCSLTASLAAPSLRCRPRPVQKKTGSASGNARICFAVHLWSLYGIYENQSFENQNLEFFWDFRGNWSVENHRLVHCLSF